MAEATRSHAGRRWARLLALLASGPAIAHAQEGACAPTAPWRASSEYWVFPHGVRAMGDALLVIGQTNYRFATGADGKPAPADTTIAGIVLARDGTVRAIARPASARSFVHPRIVARSARRTDVVWSEPDFAAGGGFGPGPHLLRAGTLDNGRWRGIRELGRFELNTALTREVGSDLVRVGGVTYMAFPDEPPAASGATSLGSSAPRIVMLSDSGGRWRTTALDFDLAATGAAELGDDDGTPVLIFLGMTKGNPEGRRTRRPTVYVSRHERAGWSRPVQVGGSEDAQIQFPKLVRHGGALIATWVSAVDTPALEWREITGARPMGDLQRLDGVFAVTQGQAPFRDLLSIMSADQSVRVVRLRPDGHDDIASVPVSFAMPPVVSGTTDRPWALTAELSSTPNPGPVRLVAYDLRCALRR